MQKGSQTGLVFFPAFDWALSPTHPERQERLLYTRDQIFEEGLRDLPQITEYKPRLATAKDVARTHFCVPDIERQVKDAHLVAAGGALTLADALMSGKIKNGFALVRPPGHHAMQVVHGNRGFCNINNEAILVDYLRRKYNVKRIAIVDTDVHHGDGTQDIFYHDPDVLFISFHQDGRTLYPGSGFMEEAGSPMAYGRTLNIPLPPGTDDEGLGYVLDKLILPIIKEFEPELIINSAGQDNHFSDPLANMKISAQGYGRLTEKLKPDLVILEGGYAIEDALPYVNTGILLALAGLDYQNVKEPDYREGMFAMTRDKWQHIEHVVNQVSDIWSHRNSFDIESLQKKDDFFKREKNIFYDTDGISEFQREAVKYCIDCHGYKVIRSEAKEQGKGLVRVFCISLPYNACQNCSKLAYSEYESHVMSHRYDYVYIQDKARDRHHCYFSATGETWNY